MLYCNFSFKDRVHRNYLKRCDTAFVKLSLKGSLKKTSLSNLCIIWRTFFHNKEPFVKQKCSSDVKGSLWNNLDKKRLFYGIVKHLTFFKSVDLHLQTIIQHCERIIIMTFVTNSYTIKKQTRNLIFLIRITKQHLLKLNKIVIKNDLTL